MRQEPRPETPLDARWLQLLSERCADLRGGGARFEDLYLEQRLEVRAVASGGELLVESCRLEGAAARWRSPSRSVLHARTGLSASALGELLGRQADRVALPPSRPLPAAEIDPPRRWLEWAREVASRLGPAPSVIRYLSRRAAVVRSDGWVQAASPALVRVERSGDRPTTLLAVWGHPQLGHWLTDLLEPPPAKPWQPSPGAQLPVLFTAGTAGTLMHELIGHMAESDLVATAASPLAGMKGATITTSSLDIIDDPTRVDLAGAFDHDDEGVAGRPIPLVVAGRLQNYLCDREGSRRLSDDPGRGRRAGWNRPPITRQSNLVVAPGKYLPEELEGDLENALVVTRIGGATVDPVSLRTVLRVERGWEVRHGRRRRPLAPCELTGGALEILARIDSRIGSDPTTDWRLGWCVKDGLPLATGSEAPTLLVERLEVL
jgi:hypothetical protein